MSSRKPISNGDYFSQALKYETDLLELIKGRSGLQNAELIVQHSFAVLDQCIPQLGQFVRLIQLIRDQLYDAVYSEKMTECGGVVARLPYFKIIESIEIDAEKKLHLKSQDTDVVTKRLYEKQLEYENLEAEFATAGSEIRTLRVDLSDQIRTTEILENEIKNIKEIMANQTAKYEDTIHSLKLNIAELKHDVDDKQKTITELEKFKDGYNALDNAFFRWPVKIANRIKEAEEAKHPAIFTPSSSFKVSTENGRYEAGQSISMALTRQIEELEQQLIKDFEKNDDTIKTALTNRRLITDNLDAAIEAEEEEMAAQAKKAVRFERNFTGFVAMAAKEVNLLQEHKNNMTAIVASRAMKEKNEKTQVDPEDRSKDVVPSEPITEAAENPFTPNELVLSKFSIIVQVSQDGLHFYDLPVNEPCGLCGLMSVLVCPHRILSHKITVPLTPNTLYLRIIRPTLRMTTSDIAPPNSAESVRPSTPDLTADHISADTEIGSSGIATAYGRPKPRDLSDEKSLEPFSFAVFQCVESKLFAADPPKLDESQVYTYCEEIIAYLLSCEYAVPRKTDSLFDCIFNFFEQKYKTKRAAHLVIGDLIHNIPFRVTSGDRYLQLFTQMLTGVVDSCLLKYASLLADAVLTIDWRHPADYWAFALICYPFLDEEDIDVVQMNYTSFTEGHINAAVVLEYQLFCLLRGTEMRYQHMFEQLHEMASGNPSFYLDEFLRAARDLLPNGAYDKNKVKALFEEAYLSTLFWKNKEEDLKSNPPPQPLSTKKMTKKLKKTQSSGGIPQLSQVRFFNDAISTERAAQILCYLDLLAIIDSVKDNLWSRVLEMRTAPPPQFEILVSGIVKETETKTRPIVRYGDVHKIAFQYNKFKMFKLRENLEYQTGRPRRRSRNEQPSTDQKAEPTKTK